MNLSLMVRFLVLGLVAAQVTAASGNDNVCEGQSSSAALLRCAERSKKEADKKLNDSYKMLLGRLLRQHDNSDFSKGYAEKVRASQRLWIRQRDVDCQLKTFEVDPGSWADVVITDFCIVKLSNSRVEFLNSIAPDTIEKK